MKDKFVMLDLETLGVGMNPVIAQIAAVVFDLDDGATGEVFQSFVMPQSCIDAGFTVNYSTIQFWFGQSEEAKKQVFGNEGVSTDISHALSQFSKFILDLEKDGSRVYLWGNGIRADNVWLLSAYDKLGIDRPIGYSQDLDFRTLHYLSKLKTGIDFKKLTPGDKYVKHNALDDCRWQIDAAQLMWKALKD